MLIDAMADSPSIDQRALQEVGCGVGIGVAGINTYPIHKDPS